MNFKSYLDKMLNEAKSDYDYSLPDGSGTVRIYDTGKDVPLDRYTAIFTGKEWDAPNNVRPGFKMSLGFGPGISQWGEAKEGSHLGKKIKFTDLSKEWQDHVIYRATKEGN